MHTYMLLQVKEDGTRILLHDPVMLFDGSLSRASIQELRAANGAIDGVSEAGNDAKYDPPSMNQVSHSTIHELYSIDMDQALHSTEHALRSIDTDQAPYSKKNASPSMDCTLHSSKYTSYNTASAPCIALQGESNARYLLTHSIINAGIGRYRDYTASYKQSRWQAAKLRIDAQLKDERLFLVHCIDHVMLSWRRVDDALKPLGSAHAVIRNEEHMIVYSGHELSEETLRGLEVFASRALYALWLDVGSVLVAVSGTGSMAVREVWSIEQRQLPLDRELLRHALQQWLNDWEADARRNEEHSGEEGQFLLGADPEFILVNNEQKVVSASDYLLDYNSLYVGVDALLYKNKLIYPIVELRPAPEADPNRLFASLYRLLKEATDAITDKQLRWLAGGMPIQGIALGGHLHISGIRLTPRLLRVLDAVLAIPYAAVADQAGMGRLRKFGGLGDYRRQFHGGFEYRTLPSWLVSPALTKAAIVSCWLAVAHRQELAARLESPLVLEEAYVANDRERLAREALNMLELLSALATEDASYEYELNKALEPLKHALQQRKTWDEQIDLRKRWSLLDAAVMNTKD